MKRNFARKYVSSAGIPLVEKVNRKLKNPKESKKSEESLAEKVQNLEYLEVRVQILETLLKDYYLDVYCLEKVKEVIINHRDSLKMLEIIKQNKNDDSVEKIELMGGNDESV